MLAQGIKFMSEIAEEKKKKKKQPSAVASKFSNMSHCIAGVK